MTYILNEEKSSGLLGFWTLPTVQIIKNTTGPVQ
jgi:hypothetical protein